LGKAVEKAAKPRRTKMERAREQAIEHLCSSDDPSIETAIAETA
jgi:hypothetical protein